MSTSASRFTWRTFGESIGVFSLSLLHVHRFSVYEDRELQAAEKRAQERLEFENQMIKVQTMLDFERSRNTSAHAEQVKNEVAALESALDKYQKNEKKYRRVSRETPAAKTCARVR